MEAVNSQGGTGPVIRGTVPLMTAQSAPLHFSNKLRDRMFPATEIDQTSSAVTST